MDGARYLIGRRFNLALHPEPTKCQFCNRQFCAAEMKTNWCAQEKSFLNGVTMPPVPRIQNVCSLRKKQWKKNQTSSFDTRTVIAIIPYQCQDLRRRYFFWFSSIPISCCVSVSLRVVVARSPLEEEEELEADRSSDWRFWLLGGKKGVCVGRKWKGGENEAAVVTPLNRKGREISSQVEGLKMY